MQNYNFFQNTKYSWLGIVDTIWDAEHVFGFNSISLFYPQSALLHDTAATFAWSTWIYKERWYSISSPVSIQLSRCKMIWMLVIVMLVMSPYNLVPSYSLDVCSSRCSYHSDPWWQGCVLLSGWWWASRTWQRKPWWSPTHSEFRCPYHTKHNTHTHTTNISSILTCFSICTVGLILQCEWTCDVSFHRQLSIGSVSSSEIITQLRRRNKLYLNKWNQSQHHITFFYMSLCVLKFFWS